MSAALADASAPAIVAKNLSRTFGQRRALDDVSFEVPRGAFLSVFGPNGAGKTTLLRVVATLGRPTSGELEICGTDALLDPSSIRPRLGLISHAPMLYGDLSAYENLELTARLHGIENPSRRIEELLSIVELDHRRNDPARTFSRGMTQRLSIARALVNDPEVVLLDEPYSGLDPHAAHLFDELISRVREGRTFLMVSHDLAKGYALASHVLVLARGRVVRFAEKSMLDETEFSELYLSTVGMGAS